MKKNVSLILILSFFVTTIFAQAGEQDQNALESLTSIEFVETTFNWGELNEGEKIQNVFTFTNTGSEPLIIKNAKGSCGCTVPRWPREPIMPGETADLLVEFNSKGKGKEQGSKQSKRVTITANTDPGNTYLTIKGTVFKSDKKAEEEIANRNADSNVDASALKIFPNPVQDELSLSIEGYNGKTASIDIFDAQGKRVESRKVEALGSESVRFDVSQFESGIYAVALSIEGKNKIAKQILVNAR